ncbi:hypothetical protein CYMTET_32959 [Cymbomonas tetramitiformis]|uniref:DUF3700 domain-containing protein n=1 Tax=Cymbomonas tetramitiformis TaxID=36881 RepID=A0AAE0FE87_9CHLO|nr:hypothetical protein CYMTET_32959 [Cymbomonas tetramitiformis]
MLCVFKAEGSCCDTPVECSLIKARETEDDAAAIDRCVLHPKDENGSFVAYERPDEKTRRCSGMATKMSYNEAMAGGVTCVALSRIIRKMGDKVVQRAVERNLGANSDYVTDARIILLHVQASLAKARWGKASNVLNGLSLMKRSGSQKSLAQVEGRRPRMSITDVKEFTPPVPQQPVSTTPQLPREIVVKTLCREFNGVFSFVYVDPIRKYIFAARSIDGSAPLFWYTDSRGSLVLTSEQVCIPAAIRNDESSTLSGMVPPGHFHLGAFGAPPKFVKFAELPVQAPAAIAAPDANTPCATAA